MTIRVTMSASGICHSSLGVRLVNPAYRFTRGREAFNSHSWVSRAVPCGASASRIVQYHSARLHSREPWRCNGTTRRKRVLENKLRTLTPEGEADFVKWRRKYFPLQCVISQCVTARKFIRFIPFDLLRIIVQGEYTILNGEKYKIIVFMSECFEICT